LGRGRKKRKERGSSPTEFEVVNSPRWDKRGGKRKGDKQNFPFQGHHGGDEKYSEGRKKGGVGGEGPVW